MLCQLVVACASSCRLLLFQWTFNFDVVAGDKTCLTTWFPSISHKIERRVATESLDSRKIIKVHYLCTLNLDSWGSFPICLCLK